ncbi:MAG: H/ACA ribonucleoprotein complex subunit GAR1 [Nitrososphaeria archaeon]
MPGRKRGLVRLGTFSQRLKNDTLVLTVNRIPPLGANVFDSELKEVGSVSNVFGPISHPMVEVRSKNKRDPSKGVTFYLRE